MATLVAAGLSIRKEFIMSAGRGMNARLQQKKKKKTKVNKRNNNNLRLVSKRFETRIAIF
jgi:hypothetical protein